MNSLSRALSVGKAVAPVAAGERAMFPQVSAPTVCYRCGVRGGSGLVAAPVVSGSALPVSASATASCYRSATGSRPEPVAAEPVRDLRSRTAATAATASAHITTSRRQNTKKMESLMSDLHARAAKIFGSGSDGVRWPYDVSGIDRTLRRTDPERYERQLAELERKRLVIVEWAEHHGLKGSPVRCCPWWLTRKVSRRCEFTKCTQYGASAQTVDSGWLDHTISWLKDSRPAVITSAPYNFGQKDGARLDWWLAEDARLRVAYGVGWYGYGTRQIVMWRADRIETVDPAAAEVTP